MSKIGGMQRVGIDLLHQLEQHRDTTVETVILRSARENDYLGFLPFLVRAFFTARSLMQADKIDVVLFSAMPSAVLAPVLSGVARKTRIPLAAISHGHDVIAQNALYQWLVRKVLDRLDAMLPVSRSTGEQCLERGLSQDRLFVTPNGIDPDRFGHSYPGIVINRAARRAVLGEAFPQLAEKISPSSLVLCSVGRQVKRKGHEWFIRHVMPALNPNVHLVLGGKGPETDSIRQAVTDTGLQSRVHLLGIVPEEKLASLYTGGDLFVMPNIKVEGDMEGFGVVMLEAGLCGMAAIAARLEGIQDVVTDGKNGFNVDAMDIAGYKKLIDRFADNLDLLDPLYASSRVHTIETFSWPQIAARIIDTLSTVVRRKRGQV